LERLSGNHISMNQIETDILRNSDSSLFIIRMWLEDLGNNKSEWRAHVRHIPSGCARYIRTWRGLQHFLEEYGGHFSEHVPANSGNTSE
jgi:hypothetical protein